MVVTTAPPLERAKPPIPTPSVEPGWTIRRPHGLIILAALLVVSNVLLATGTYIPWASPALGAVVLLGIPSFLIYMADLGRFPANVERLIASVVLSVLLIMGAGLVANTILPHLGISNPLGGFWTAVTVDSMCVALGACLYRRHPSCYRLRLPRVGGRDQVMVGLGVLAVVLSVMGAVRLNNGAGGGLTLVMLVVVLVALALLVAWHSALKAGVIHLVIYLVSLALLLMTSLRGWYTTGHDVQLEYRVFELTKVHSAWNISLFRDAYNACLSITILPTMIVHLTRVADPYVYKVFFQLLFAMCPVLVYRLSKRVAPTAVALVATIYFISFVTFFQDMPMLNRQEIAFLFLTLSLLALFNDHIPTRARRWWFCVFGAGVVVSHYSTTYMMVGVLVVAWGLRVSAPRIRSALSRVGPRRFARTASSATAERSTAPLLGVGVLVVIAALAFLWSTPLTHTEQGLSGTISAALDSLRGSANPGAKSSDTANSFLFAHQPNPAERLAEYQTSSNQATAADRKAGIYYSASVVARYPTPIAAEVNVPITGIGRALHRIGVDVGALNRLIRQGSARLLQLFIGIGLLATVFGRRRWLKAPPEFVYLAAANIVIVVLQVVLPVLSVNYGLLRAFQQALIILDVFLVAGTLCLVPKVFRRWAMTAVTALALVFFASSTGMLTQVLGGYQPQLHLDNAGTYYDIYYLHPQEKAGISWIMANVPAARQGDVQAEVQTDRYNFSPLSSLHAVNTQNDILPSLVRRDAYVFLGYSNVNNEESTVSVAGDLVTYHYPVSFLDDNKDLIYSSNGARVYR